MQEKENLNQFIGSIGIRFPTAQALYDEIGLPLESLAAVFPSSRNDILNKYGNQVPLEFYRVPGEKAIQAVMNVWEEEIKGYIGIHHSQQKHGEDIWKKWEAARPSYERGLELLRNVIPDPEEIKHIQAEIDSDYDPAYIYMVESETVTNNKEIILKRLEPILKKVPEDKFKMIVEYYDGYVRLFSLPFISCVSVRSCTNRGKIV